MKKILIAMAAVALSSCSVLTGLAGIPSSPKAVAEQTVLDERIALGMELAYQAAAFSAVTAIKAGVVPQEQMKTVRDADQMAYNAVLMVRNAYKAGNADSYLSASSDARAAISAMMNLLKGF